MRHLIYIFSLFFIFSFTSFKAQTSFANQIPGAQKYDPTKVVDSEYGIQMYEKLIFALGGDSVRYNKKGYNVQGWMEDFYTTGTILHKGFYEDGQLKVFKNFYPNGNVERSFRIIDLKRCEQIEYFQDGKIKSEIIFYDGNTQKQTDYYPNGVISYVEESEKNNDYLYKRNSYKEDGNPTIIFEILDKKKKTYTHKEYFDNGKLKEEGEMKFSVDASDYVKEGTWIYYDESGKETRKEKYHNGGKID
ncbi:MAG: hypothetical protein IPG89_15175 [Bacteroidetes bacterium]|nr:hypothetical protein [Bacteroidota bacterium]